LLGETLWYRMVASGVAPRYVRLRPRSTVSAILDGRTEQALPDAINHLISKTTVEILTLRPSMCYGLSPVRQSWTQLVRKPVSQERNESTMTTTQAGLSLSDPEAYRGNLFKLLGDRSPLEVLAQTASTLAEVVRKRSATVLRTRPLKENGRPMRSSAISPIVYGYRLRLILCEDNPPIRGTNQDLWVAGQRHNEREPSELVEMFRTMRQFNLALWKRIAAADLERTGQHNERGPESLGVMLRMMAGHDLSHLGQIVRYIQAITK
jgi:hypothetical protein